ncbi:MAG: GspE/PulE family protein [Thermodesulfobacteriota bacterium]|nr:GspE/PulE family protein [Thermodesulfobacteriota bacterium]
MALLGEILLENNRVTPQKLSLALKEQKRTHELMGDVLVRLGIISRKDLSKAIAIASDIPFIDLKQTVIDQVAVKQVPKEIAGKFKLIPFAAEDELICVAMDNPNDVVALDTLRRTTGKTIEIFAADIGSINDAVEMYYEVGTSIEEEIDRNVQAAITGGLAQGEIIPPIVRLVELFIIKSIRDHATDVHITPEEMATRLSYRVDGILRSGTILPKQLHIPIVNRIKIMSGCDIAEQRLPQEGNITFDFSDRRIDIRSAISPCSHGENVVLRILDKESVLLGIEYLGLGDHHSKIIEKLVLRPHGIILVSGPTGSGKTTTLYSMLTEINALEKNILTIEDPIEYNLPLIRQTQVNEQAGLTFSKAIRHFLRQDPDIILVGEIRDPETAGIAFQAAMTGHLVLSTIHTNDSASSIPRLLDLGVEPYLIPSSVRAVIAQRLVRKICPSCREEYTPDKRETALYDLKQWKIEGKTLVRGSGCPNCEESGYHGRTGIFEIMELSAEISELISRKTSSDVLLREAGKQGMRTMREDGMKKVLSGITTVHEVFRVT